MKYSIEMLEEEIKRKRNKFIVRNGCFVGLYKYEKKDKVLLLTKKINKETYGMKEIMDVKNNAEAFGCGGYIGVSSLICCNEVHIIPKRHDLRRKNILKKLESCLGDCYSVVNKRIEEI